MIGSLVLTTQPQKSNIVTLFNVGIMVPSGMRTVSMEAEGACFTPLPLSVLHCTVV